MRKIHIDTSRAWCPNVDITAVVWHMFLLLAFLSQVLHVQCTALQPLSLGVLWLRCLRCLDLFDNLKSLFLNVPSGHVHPLCLGQLKYDLCTLVVNLMLLPSCVRDAITIMFTASTL